MIIQFGYVTLFAASFPLAALCAMVNNVTEIRSDAWLLCRGHQRPEWRTQEDIGSWSRILFFISMINTMVNAALTAFVGAQLDETNGTFTTRIRSYRLWMIAVLIEHAVLGCKALIQVVMPSEPDWVERAQKVLDYRQDLEPEKRLSLKPGRCLRHRAYADDASTVRSSDDAAAPGPLDRGGFGGAAPPREAAPPRSEEGSPEQLGGGGSGGEAAAVWPAAEAEAVTHAPARLGRTPPAADGVIPVPREVAEQLSRRSPRGSPPQPPPPTAGVADSAAAMRSWRGLSVNVGPSLVVKPETVVSL